MNEKIISQIESLLLVANKELAIKKIAEAMGVKEDEIFSATQVLKEKYNLEASGINLIINNNKLQLVTNSNNAQIIQEFLKEEEKGELTQPSLEALTIIAYRQPLPKREIEKIRGVNCSLILRNLMIRGLIEAKEDSKRMETNYSVTTDFLKYLGINEVSQLPDFEKLNNNENLKELLSKKEEARVKIDV